MNYYMGFHVGMDEKNIEKYISDLSRSIACSICLSHIDNARQFKCSHVFCANCMVEALKIRSNCPLCSFKILKNEISVPIATITPIVKGVTEIIQFLEKFKNQKTSGLNNNNSIESSNFSTSDNHPSNALLHKPRKVSNKAATYKPGETVHVLSRTWPGINKEGGTAWVLARHDCDATDHQNLLDDCTYDVKYVLSGSREFNVPSRFVQSCESSPPKRMVRNRITQTALESTQSTARTSASSHHLLATENARGEEFSRRGRKRPRQVSAPTPSEQQVFPRAVVTEETQDTTSLVFAAPSAAPPPSLRVVLLPSSLVEADRACLSRFVRDCPSRILPPVALELETQHSATVTHVVVSVGEDGVLESRTMKYLQALIAGKWVVRAAWLEDSLVAGRLLPEVAYEVRQDRKASVPLAPRRARLAWRRGFCTLFHGVLVLLYGQFPSPGPPRNALEELVATGGGRTVTSSEVFFQALNLQYHSHNQKRKANSTDYHMFVVVTAEDMNDSDKQRFQPELQTAVKNLEIAAKGLNASVISGFGTLLSGTSSPDIPRNILTDPTESDPASSATSGRNAAKRSRPKLVLGRALCSWVIACVSNFSLMSLPPQDVYFSV